MTVKPFERWKEEELQRTFGIKRVWRGFALLENWLDSNETPTPEQQKALEVLHNELFENVDYWNEDELKFMFISQLVYLVKYRGKGYTTFTQRTLSATLTDIKGNNVLMKGKPELMVATGLQDPYQPFFFLHEYKPEKKNSDADPLGQLLAAMLTTQQINEQKFPLYGCYVNGRNWFFVVLDGAQYSVSNGFMSTKYDELMRRAYLEKEMY
jgi:hypothetical protein